MSTPVVIPEVTPEVTPEAIPATPVAEVAPAPVPEQWYEYQPVDEHQSARRRQTKI